MNTIKPLEELCLQIRRDILKMVHKASSGHPGGALGTVEYFVALYKIILRHQPNPFHKEGKKEDLFFLSNGHISAVYYSILARCGYFPIKELNTFRFIHSRLQGHPTPYEGLEGVRIASGSLGQGMSVAIGAALAKKLNKENRLIYSLHGDGELNEGQIWEAALYAGAKGIDNYIATIDYNQQQIDGSIEEVLPLGDLRKKFESFNWIVLEEKEGNKLEKVILVLKKAIDQLGKKKPVMILLHTQMGQGVDFMTKGNLWHGKAPNDQELKKALDQLPETSLGDYPMI